MATMVVPSISRRTNPLWKTALVMALRFILAVVLFVVCIMVATGLSPVTQSSRKPDPAQALLALLGMGVMYTIALGYPVIRSRWTGWKLILGLLVAYVGVTPLLLQVESLVFVVLLVPTIPVPVLQAIVLHGFVSALLFTPLLVLVLGKMRGQASESPSNQSHGLSAAEWAWKLALIGVFYAVIYFSFGVLVAKPLAGPVFDQYYHEMQVPTWMPLFQVARGIFWALIMVPVIRMMDGRWWEGGLAVALLSSFLSSALLLSQNEYMPDAMRFAHFFELLSSNFVFGWVIFWLFHRHHASPRDLLGSGKTSRS